MLTLFVFANNTEGEQGLDSKIFAIFVYNENLLYNEIAIFH